MRYRIFLIAILVMSAMRLTGQTRGEEVFTTPTVEAIPYRIPAITTLRDGSLLTIADYRHCRSDIGYGRIDLHLRSSKDGGRTWGTILKPLEMQGDGDLTPGHQKAGYGDPCIVADRKSDRVLVISCSGGPLFARGSRSHHQGMARFWSNDGGQTWTEPEYLDEEMIYKPLDASQYGAIRGWFVASGRILQSRFVKAGKYYRLYCAGTSINARETANWVLYSDDFGATWSFLGGADASPIPGGDEAKCEELPDGNLLLSSRAWGGRRFNIFRFTNRKKAQGGWGTMAFSGVDNHGVLAKDNACNGELLAVRVREKESRKKTCLLLQSVPLGPGRANVGIYYKALPSPASYTTPEVIAADWSGPYQVTDLKSAYSTMTLLHDGTIGFFYEEETHCGVEGGGFTLVYRNLTIEDITGGKYTKL
ncbi:MAG: glycoside hydrolase [Bacteroidaceae bacterium]|nr:glycoside hydrolase [Bacteroidaceae bacterium]